MTLIIELIWVSILIAPLPNKVQHAVVVAGSHPRLKMVKKASRYVIGFVVVMFLDATNKVIGSSSSSTSSGSSPSMGSGGPLIREDRHEFLKKMFFLQRNMYLCGATIFLYGIGWCIFGILEEKDLIRIKIETRKKNEKVQVEKLNEKIVELDEKKRNKFE